VPIGSAAIVTAGILIAAIPLWAQRPSADTIPVAVVQRFVDAANARDILGMMATVAPEAIFSVLPSGTILGAGQDSIRAFYAAIFARLKPGFTVEVTRRMQDGGFVIDHEVFHQQGLQTPTGQATWVYWVAGGLIRHAWTLRPPQAP
jgi:hypothetical protein